MGFTKRGGDLIVTNQLKVDIRVINRAQAWAEQVRGLYHFIYPHIVDDFSHTKDIHAWISEVFATHVHGTPGCKHKSTTLDPGVSSQIPDKNGKGLLVNNAVLGKVRKGISDLARLVAGTNRVNNERLR